MNKTIFVMLGVILLSAHQLLAQETLFSANFDDGDLGALVFWEDVPVETGSWTAPLDPVLEDPFLPFGGGNWGVSSIGLIPSPYGDDDNKMFYLDRANHLLEGGEPLSQEEVPFELDPSNGDFTGFFTAELTETVGVVGSQVAFQMLISRAGGNEQKSYSVIGRDEDGEASFHLRVSANNNGGERLGYVTEDGTEFDLPTITGSNSPQVLNATGGLNIDNGPGLGANVADIQLRLGADGFVVELSYPEGNTHGKEGFRTAKLPYEGDASELAQIDFTYEASTNNNRNTGYVLDNVLVTGFEDLLLGDLDFNGQINDADFELLSDNFGTTNAEGDFNFDGLVDLDDWIGFKAAYNAANAPEAASVPEPSSSLLLVVGGLVGLLARRRR